MSLFDFFVRLLYMGLESPNNTLLIYESYIKSFYNHFRPIDIPNPIRLEGSKFAHSAWGGGPFDPL